MIGSIQGSYQTQAITYTAQGTRNRNTAQPASSGDTVSLSENGKLLSDFFSGMGVQYSSGGPISLNDLKAGLQQKQQGLESDINALFLENGISTSPSVTLTTDEEGRVRVNGDHPQKAEIEALFEDNPDLSNDFRTVSAQSSLVNAGDVYSAFAALYAEDPNSAVEQYFDLLKGKTSDGFSLTIEDGGEATEANHVPRPDFTNTTRQELMDWVNSEITSGRMSLDESTPFVAMTLKFSTATESVDMAADNQRYNFKEIAQKGIEGALYRGNEDMAERLQHALELMSS